MLQVGIIGLGSTWEQRYRPALWRLRDRLQIAGVYDPVSAKASQVATELRTFAVDGIWELLSRSQIKGVLVLDPDWLGHIPLQMACQHGKSVFVAGSLGPSLEAMTELQHCADDAGIDLMPELSRRYTPATIRLRELLATRLGRPRRIRVELHLPPQADTQLPLGQSTELDALVGLVDWCRCLVGRGIESAVSRVSPATSARRSVIRELDVTFLRSAADGEPARAEIRLHQEQLATQNAPTCLWGHVDCSQGHASVSGPKQLHWKAGGNEVEENLNSERSELEVMLDHFSRRLVGGLIPVPQVSDVCLALKVIEATCAGMTYRNN